MTVYFAQASRSPSRLPSLGPRAWPSTTFTTRARERGIRITPVFDGLSPSDAAERVSRLGIEIGENNGHIIDPKTSPPETAAAIAWRYMGAAVRAAHREGRQSAPIGDD